MNTAADRIVDQLNDYEQWGGDNVWDDMIAASRDYDYRATELADPQGLSTLAVFKDGSRVRYLEDQRRWVTK